MDIYLKISSIALSGEEKDWFQGAQSAPDHALSDDLGEIYPSFRAKVERAAEKLYRETKIPVLIFAHGEEKEFAVCAARGVVDV